MDYLKDEIISAPMAGYTNEPFRLSLKELNVKITFTEMISVEGLARRIEKTLNMVRIIKEPPVIVPQIFGHNPDSFPSAIEEILKLGFNHIDINLGCPAKKVIKKGSGVALMKYPETVKKIIKTVRKNFPNLFISAKLRLGFDDNSINYIEISKILYDEGINAIILHPRTGMQYFSGKADWSHIKKLKEMFSDLIIIGNGDVKTVEDIERMYRFTNCDGIMIGRGFLENPFLKIQWDDFKDSGKYEKFTLNDKIEYFKKLFEKLKEFYGEGRAFKMSIKYFIYLTKGEKGAKKIREKLSKIKNCVEFFNEIMYWLKNGY